MQGSKPVECEVLNVIQAAGIWPDCDDKTQLLQAINTLISGGGNGGGGGATPLGTVLPFAGATAPEGFMLCDGTELLASDHADLYAVIGTVWGHGDQIATFNLPDLRGEFVRGFDAGRGVDADRVFGAAQSDEIKEHDHGIGVAGTVSGACQGGANFVPTGLVKTRSDNTGGTETRPRNIAMTYAIKAFYPVAASA